MLSIALFTECYHPMRNGIVVSVASFTRVLTALGHDVTIFTARHPEQEPEDAVYRFPSITFPTRVKYPLPIPLATGKARQLMREQAFDVIHSHSPMLLGLLANAYHRRSSIPLVFTYHTLIEEYTHYVPLPQGWVRRRAIEMSREYCNAADYVIAPCAHVASRLRRYQVTSPITVIPTGIDLDLIDQVPDGEVRERLQIPDGVPMLAYAGRIAKEKNIPRVIRAFTQILRHEPDTHLVLIGGGPYEAAIRSVIEQAGVGERTRMTGYVTRDEVIQCLRAADVFVFASRTETQGLVLGEAMACGIPVVSVAADAQRELITSGDEGVLVPDADGPFAEAVLTLLRDTPLRRRMGAQARLRAEGISAQRCTERLLEVYHQLIGGRAPRTMLCS